jgi:hypothetical protein
MYWKSLRTYASRRQRGRSNQSAFLVIQHDDGSSRYSRGYSKASTTQSGKKRVSSSHNQQSSNRNINSKKSWSVIPKQKPTNASASRARHPSEAENKDRTKEKSFINCQLRPFFHLINSSLQRAFSKKGNQRKRKENQRKVKTALCFTEMIRMHKLH